MKFMLALYGDESGWEEASPEEAAAEMARYEAFDKVTREAGVMLGGEGLQPTSTATTLRISDGERLVTDGPFAETKEQLGGFYVLECKGLDEALEWAARCPAATDGCIEIRPVIDYEAFESEQSTA